MDEPNFLEEIKTWEHPPWYGILQYEEKVDVGEATNDFWSTSGSFIYRHHVEPRVKLHSPREESFPIPLKYIDVSRTTHTNLDVMQESRIDDNWNIDRSRDLSDSWTSFTQFTLLDGKPPDEYMWSGERLTKRQATSRPDHLCPELGTKLGRNAKLREKQKWSIEKPKFANARRLRGIYFIDLENTRKNWKHHTAQHCRLGLFQVSDFAGDLEDVKSTSRKESYVLWKPSICHHQLDVQETNVSKPQFYRIWNHFVGCWTAIGWTICSRPLVCGASDDLLVHVNKVVTCKPRVNPRPQEAASINRPQTVAPHPFPALTHPPFSDDCARENLLVELGSDHLDRLDFLSSSPVFTTSWFSTRMNVLSSSEIWSLRCCCKPSKIVSTRMSPPAGKSANHFESTPEIFARTLWCCVGPKHPRLAGICTGMYNQKKTLFGSHPLVQAAARRAPPVTLLRLALAAVTPSPVETHQVWSLRGKRWVSFNWHASSHEILKRTSRWDVSREHLCSDTKSTVLPTRLRRNEPDPPIAVALPSWTRTPMQCNISSSEAGMSAMVQLGDVWMEIHRPNSPWMAVSATRRVEFTRVFSCGLAWTVWHCNVDRHWGI